jgi:hypothetical protein
VATSQLRLLVEARIIEPYPVPARPLPPDVRPAVRKVYEGFLFLLACKWWHTPQAPTPFSWRFAAAWCGVGERHVGEAMQWLLARGYLHQVGRYRQMALFFAQVGTNTIRSAHPERGARRAGTNGALIDAGGALIMATRNGWGSLSNTRGFKKG